jgi:hypothetical protein
MMTVPGTTIPGWPPAPDALLARIQPEHIAACFQPAALADGAIQNLLEEPRFHPRLLRVLEQHYGLEAADRTTSPEPAASLMFLASRDQIASLALACGVVINATTFTQAVQAIQVRALHERFGSSYVEVAVSQRALACSRPIMDNIDALHAAVVRAGEGCITAWLSELPEPVLGWLRLRGIAISSDTVVEDDVKTKGPLIVRTLAADWLKTEVGV